MCDRRFIPSVEELESQAKERHNFLYNELVIIKILCDRNRLTAKEHLSSLPRNNGLIAKSSHYIHQVIVNNQR